jgi:FtsP/CotA-like multicopper oxidase with cupredoxin domain
MRDANFSSVTRRAFLAGVTATAAWPSFAGSVQDQQLKLVTKPARVPIVGGKHPRTEVWSYDGRIPGPTIRAKQGRPLRVIVENNLAEDTTVHWHGIRLPNVMDGVPGLTQTPIKPGASFLYEFTPPDAGSFWYHPHADSLRQLGRGMAGVLIVEEPEPLLVDRDVAWLLSDWRLTSDAQIASGFGNGMEAAMSGRLGNTATVNGYVSNEEPVLAGERIRLRLINGALARIMAIRFEGHRPVIVAIDGQPCEPHLPPDGRLVLGPAMRIDVILDMTGEPGRRYRVVDDFYDGLAYWLTQLAYEEVPTLRGRRHDAPPTLPSNPVPEPDLATAERHELHLQGGMMGGGTMAGMGMSGVDRNATWAINGMSMTGDGHAGMAPLLTLERGRSYLLTIRNDTAWWHPIHLHGHSFRLLRRNATSVPYRQWADTVLVPPRESVDLAFVADNPGDWMLHCHVTDHQVSGLMTVLRVA